MSQYGESALIDAALDGDLNGIVSNMELAGRQATEGLTALHICARQGFVEGVMVLANSEVGLQDDQGNTALMHAVRADCAEAVRILAKCEANQVNLNGETALQIAERYGSSRDIILALEALETRRPNYGDVLQELQ